MKETKIPASPTSAAPAKNTGGIALAPPANDVSVAVQPITQAKLLVGHPNDPLEHEADRAADRVVSLWQGGGFSSAPAGDGPPAKPITPIIRRRAASPAAGSAEASPQVAQQIQAARGSGQPLPGELLPPLEATFGMDFSGVRLHTDHRADALNRDLQARAFATGQDIFFRQGEYRPGTAEGIRLLGHELGHVGQQEGGMMVQRTFFGMSQRTENDAYDIAFGDNVYSLNGVQLYEVLRYTLDQLESQQAVYEDFYRNQVLRLLPITDIGTLGGAHVPDINLIRTFHNFIVVRAGLARLPTTLHRSPRDYRNEVASFDVIISNLNIIYDVLRLFGTQVEAFCRDYHIAMQRIWDFGIFVGNLGLGGAVSGLGIASRIAINSLFTASTSIARLSVIEGHTITWQNATRLTAEAIAQALTANIVGVFGEYLNTSILRHVDSRALSVAEGSLRIMLTVEQRRNLLTSRVISGMIADVGFGTILNSVVTTLVQTYTASPSAPRTIEEFIERVTSSEQFIMAFSQLLISNAAQHHGNSVIPQHGIEHSSHPDARLSSSQGGRISIDTTAHVPAISSLESRAASVGVSSDQMLGIDEAYTRGN